VRFSKSSAAKTRPRSYLPGLKSTRIDVERAVNDHGLKSAPCNLRNVPTKRSNYSVVPTPRDPLVGASVWAWMEKDRWWPAVILAPTSRSPFDGVIIRLPHGVTVAVPISFISLRGTGLESGRPAQAPTAAFSEICSENSGGRAVSDRGSSPGGSVHKI
jgi:hypothetical protein